MDVRPSFAGGVSAIQIWDELKKFSSNRKGCNRNGHSELLCGKITQGSLANITTVVKSFLSAINNTQNAPVKLRGRYHQLDLFSGGAYHSIFAGDF